MDFWHSVPGVATIAAAASAVGWLVTKSIRKTAIAFVAAAFVVTLVLYLVTLNDACVTGSLCV